MLGLKLKIIHCVLDIKIFSNSPKKVMILIKLTYPCEKAWEKASQKIDKYVPLETITESNGWSKYHFAKEVRA